MAQLGTYAWVRQTGGRLSLTAYWALLAQGARAQAAARADSKRFARAERTLRHADLADLTPPDSAVAKAAAACCADASPAHFYHHCARAYLWARLLHDGPAYDDEAVYVAIMLHDLGLTDAYRVKPDGCVCFTAPAAEQALRFASAHGWSEVRALRVADAICLHLNVIVDASHGPEATMVRLGSGADIAGLGLSRIDADTRAAVHARHASHGLKRCGLATLQHEADSFPRSRIRFLFDRADFARRIAASPLPE